MSTNVRIAITLVLILIIILINKASAQDSLKISRQIKAIMKEKNSRTRIQQKIDSRLLQAIREKKTNKPDPTGLEPANVNADKNGNLQVDIRAAVTDALLNKIKTLGGKIIFASKEYQSIKAEINLSMVEKIAAYPEIKFIEPAALMQLNRPVNPGNKLLNPGTDSPASDL